jgi:integrase
MAWAEQRANGQWTGIYRDPGGRKRSAGTVLKKKDAQALAQREEDKIRLGRWVDPAAGTITFTDYFEQQWIVHRTLEINGRAYYWGNYRAPRHGLKTKFGDMPLARIRRPMVQAWVTDMIADGLSPRTVKSRVATLQAVLAARDGVSAINDSLIVENPVDRVTIPPVPARKVAIYTPDQVDKLISALDAWWRLMVWFDSETGLRWGELLGVQVKDIDFLRRHVTVHQTIIETAKAATGNGTPFALKPYPKDKDARVVGLSQDTIDMISAHTAARGLQREDFLFSMPVLRTDPAAHTVLIEEVQRSDVWPQGMPVSRSYFRSAWTKAIRTAGLPPRRIHDLRASFISWLLDDPTMAPQHVMDIAGHNRWDTTKKYATGMGRAQELGVQAIHNVRQRYRTPG